MSAITPLNLVSPFVIILNASGTNVVAPLTPAMYAAGNFYYFKRIDSGSFTAELQVSGVGDTIDGASTYSIPANTAVQLYCDGSKFYIISKT